jgi:hypothetical protein
MGWEVIHADNGAWPKFWDRTQGTVIPPIAVTPSSPPIVFSAALGVSQAAAPNSLYPSLHIRRTMFEEQTFGLTEFVVKVTIEKLYLGRDTTSSVVLSSKRVSRFQRSILA